MLIKYKDLLKYFKETPKGVLHIGAHKAEELSDYVSGGVESIIWIEANPKLLQQLATNTSNHPGSSVYFFAAFNIDDELISFNIANNGESSSILDLGTHLFEHPQIKYIDKISIPTKKIDTLFEQKGFDKSKFTFVNIDIQGAELLALQGMTKQLKYVNHLYLEVNEKSLYVNCPLIDEIDLFLKDYGFVRVETKMTSHGWGDAFYTKL